MLRRRLIQGAVHLPVAIAVGFYFIHYALLSVQVQDAYAAPGYDMGIFDQGVWLLSRFHAPFVTVNGRNLFGDHTSFVLLLAVPLYWIVPRAQTLLVLQAGLLAGAAIPVYLLGLRQLKKVWVAAALAIAYLLNPALQHGNLEQFHPECFLVFFAAVAIYSAVEWHPRVLLAAAVGCLLVKEDTALIVFPLGLWVAYRRDARIGSLVSGTALGYLILAYAVIIRVLLGTVGFYANRIPFGGIEGLLRTAFFHPGRFWSYATSGYKPFYAWQMVAPFGGVFLIAPEVAAIGLFTFLENLLSTFPYMQQIQYHYSLPLVSIFAMGTVYAVSRLRSPRLQVVASTYVLSAAVVSCALWGLSPISRNPTYPHSSPASLAVEEVNRALAVIPPHAVVSAGDDYVSHLDHRVYCYQWPTPFRAEYWGLYNQEGEMLPSSRSVQWLAIPAYRDGIDATTFNAIASQFTLVATGGGVEVYRRVRAAPGAGLGSGLGGASGSGGASGAPNPALPVIDVPATSVPAPTG